MYIVFPDNLPGSVISVCFEFTSEANLLFYHLSEKSAIKKNCTSVAIPEEATHIQTLFFNTVNDRFAYYYPGRGYKLTEGSQLPPLVTPKSGDCYADGIVLHTGTNRSGNETETDILPFKGSVMSLHEKTRSYNEGLLFCSSISSSAMESWQLPDILELALLYNKQDELNRQLMKQQGTLLQDEEYWCLDNSVADLGVSFNMRVGTPAILSKNEKRQIRAILHF